MGALPQGVAEGRGELGHPGATDLGTAEVASAVGADEHGDVVGDPTEAGRGAAREGVEVELEQVDGVVDRRALEPPGSRVRGEERAWPRVLLVRDPPRPPDQHERHPGSLRPRVELGTELTVEL